MTRLRSNRRHPPSIVAGLAFALAGCVVSPALAAAAFPGAQGAGAATRGGHGGAVFFVKSLADRGPDTLRACVEADGPRTCIFTKGGTIRLKTSLWISKPNLTVAGQTAPGGGILITRAAGAPCADTDRDGLPDEWERAKFGNLAARPNDDANGDGYTNLEAYHYKL